MSIDLLKKWLTDHAEELETAEVRARYGASLLKNPGSAYGKAMVRLADAHAEAAKVYRRALKETEGT